MAQSDNKSKVTMGEGRARCHQKSCAVGMVKKKEKYLCHGHAFMKQITTLVLEVVLGEVKVVRMESNKSKVMTFFVIGTVVKSINAFFFFSQDLLLQLPGKPSDCL